MRESWLIGLGALLALSVGALSLGARAEQATLEAADGLTVTAEVYRVDAGPDGPSSSRPWIVLAHMAGASRGEYAAIAPRLNALGFDAIALDQRSGGSFGGVANETAARAVAKGLPQDYLAAVPDIEAGLAFARGQTSGPVLLWGSSYSAALALMLAGDPAATVDGVIAFSPGEYIRGRSVAAAAARIEVPTLIASPPGERAQWSAILEAIPADRKTGFAADTGGRHGSSSLIAERAPNAEAYWRAVEAFLKPFAPGG